MHDRSDMRNIDATSVVSVLNFNPDEWNNIPIPLVDCIKAVLHELKISSNSSQSQNMVWQKYQSGLIDKMEINKQELGGYIRNLE